MSTVSSNNSPIPGTPEPQDVVAETDVAGRGRERWRWFVGGFIAGLALALIATTVQVAGSEYTFQDAPQLLLWNLSAAPYLGAIAIVISLGRTLHLGRWAWLRPRFRTRTLMILVVYSAFLFSAFVYSIRLSDIEMFCSRKAMTFESMVKIFRERGVKAESQVRLSRETARQLQNGKIPENLSGGQAVFLRSLDIDPKVTPDHRSYRRGLIQKSYEDGAARAEQNKAIFHRLVDYYELLQFNYERARLRPWLPVEPDLPQPQ